MKTHHESRAVQFADSYAGRIRRNDRRAAVERKRGFLFDGLSSMAR